MRNPEATLDGWTLIFVREFRHAPEAVWAALTDPAELDQWSPFAAKSDLGTPGDTVLTMVDGETRMDLPATVHTATRPSLLEYTWGADVLRWELEPTDAGGTRLTLRHTLGTPGMSDKVAAGWHLCTDVLEQLLDGTPVGVIRGQDAMNHGWEELRAAYEKSFKK